MKNCVRLERSNQTLPCLRICTDNCKRHPLTSIKTIRRIQRSGRKWVQHIEIQMLFIQLYFTTTLWCKGTTSRDNFNDVKSFISRNRYLAFSAWVNWLEVSTALPDSVSSSRSMESASCSSSSHVAFDSADVAIVVARNLVYSREMTLLRDVTCRQSENNSVNIVSSAAEFSHTPDAICLRWLSSVFHYIRNGGSRRFTWVPVSSSHRVYWGYLDTVKETSTLAFSTTFC